MTKKELFSIYHAEIHRIVSIMRLMAFFLIIGTLCSYASEAASQTRFSLQANNSTLKELFGEIEKNGEYVFFYQDNNLDTNRKVSLDVKDVTVNEILDKLFDNTENTYEIVNRQIFVYRELKPKNDLVLPLQQSEKRITGKVVDTYGDPLVGVTISVKGTTTGTITDVDGAFTMNVQINSTLLVSYIGFISQEFTIGTKNEYRIQLLENVAEIDEVVVTALGISKSQRALNYAAVQLSSEEISEVHSGNVLTSMGGKVAGLDITGNKRGGSTKIVLRGTGEIASGSTNKPLFVIDGVPIDNSNNTDVDPFKGTDYGDALAGMNMDDIESISVLKGPSAAALYGSKASRGAILITTKKGTVDQGIGVEFNSNTSMLMPYNFLSQYQQEYGSGQGGVCPMTQGDALKVSEDAYGMRLNPSLTSTFIDGSEHAYVARYKPMDFYNNGFNTTNTISITGGTSKAAFRFSYGNEYYKDITPEFNYIKHNLMMRMNGQLTSRLSYDFKISFNTTNAHQRPQSGHGQFNPGTVLSILPADTDLNKLKAMGRDISTGGLINTWDGALNPYYILYQYKNNDQTYAGNGLAMVSYKILDNLKLTYRQGIELSDFNKDSTIPQGSGFRKTMAGRTDYMTQGGITKDNTKFILLNTDIFGEYNLQAGKFSMDLMAGFNSWSQKKRGMGLEAADFIAPDLYVPSNAKNQSASYTMNNKKMLGMYGSVDFGYNRFLYLTITARNDWSSTLPKDNNSYFYPSVGASLIFSEIMKLPEWFNFGKVRASWAEVGSDTSPYQLNMYYGLFAGGYPTQSGGMVYPGNISGSVLPPLNLKPMSTRSTELGLDVRFLNSRLGLDIAYYSNTTKDQILKVPIPRSSGFESSLMNAGSVNNYGFEIMLTGTPIQTKDLTWDISVNIAHNKSKVKKLHEELKSIQMYFCEAMSVMAIEGEPYGVMYGSDYLYNPDGSIQVDEAGYPLYDTSYNTYLGSAIPKVIWGMTNRIAYKDFYLNFTIDSRLGHKYYSKTSRWMYEHGTHENTIPGRDEFYANGTGLDPLKLGKIQSVVAKQNLYSGGYLRMKEIALGYRIPQKFSSKLMLRQAHVSLVFSNPFFIWRGSNFADPTFSLNSTVGMEGIENGGEPSIRSIGVNLNLKF